MMHDPRGWPALVVRAGWRHGVAFVELASLWIAGTTTRRPGAQPRAVREAPAPHLQTDALRRDLRCDLGRKRPSFFHEMTSTQTRRRFTSTTFAAAFLALVALVVAGAGVSDYLRIQENLARSRDELALADASLAQVTYDEAGNVVEADRSRYQNAMSAMKLHTDLIRSSRGQEANVYPYVGGGLLGFLVFAIMAVRSTRRA